MNKEKKVLIIGKPISEMNESEVDEVINELVKNGTLKKDQNGNYFKVYKPDQIGICINCLENDRADFCDHITEK